MQNFLRYTITGWNSFSLSKNCN